VEALRESEPAAVILGSLPGGSAEAIEAANYIREACPGTKVILVADASSEGLAIGALRAGVSEYLQGPVTAREVVEAVAKLLPPAESRLDDYHELVGGSAEIREIKDLVRRIAPMNSTVLITGETGTGKEVVARLIHRLSQRRKTPFVCVNCAAIPDTLVEGELFGHERGAFTGAVSRQVGQLRAADGGTLFLDEVGDLSASAQAKILRAMEQREVQPLGAARPLPVDMRVIAATNRDLEAFVEDGRFRTDLFYRLFVSRIHLPPLRDHASDIPLLAMHFLRQLNRTHGRHIEGFTAQAMRLLMRHHWPGNVRQLRNAIEGAVVICQSGRIAEHDLQSLRFCHAPAPAPLKIAVGSSFPTIRVQPEPESLVQALQSTNWNVSRAAELLRWSRATIYRKIAKYRLDRWAQTPVERGAVPIENGKDLNEDAGVSSHAAGHASQREQSRISAVPLRKFRGI
jgi:DNA-binding NtrC family response regulator